MSKTTKDLIIAERRRSVFNYLTLIQGERHKPKKFKHYLQMPAFLYEELYLKGIIDPEIYFIDGSAYFEFTDTEATVSFINLYACEDLHRKIDHYLVVKFAGSYPLKRGGTFF